MIRFFLLQNKSGKTRLSKYYHPFADDEKIKMENEIHRIFMQRDATFTNFVEYKSFKLVFRRYAGLFFIFAIDVTDNELLYLESIHLFVEILDHYFGNVCELDLVFGFHRAYCILDEFIIGGEVQETSKKVILQRIKELDSLET
ncbi:hypothetical protein M9434_001184 [Picochlorum sp. BPE23]|nr:hypothetical protein M9434_001184 [Picochlorum sp. BPE23]KAI8111928.1 hypothetical protein M9435_004425 [Picochlorum sp. BPE23]WPT13001.1 AP-2 complex subunit sigma [Picochlorum sp. SENEW3]|mmetsp:Transcript_6315/g.12408  ORF Transcript_6315/g.12408 Transcript_6315/m.12408 type:complete len:144 (-) Transcript_6315:1074-1505(-)